MICSVNSIPRRLAATGFALMMIVVLALRHQSRRSSEPEQPKTFNAQPVNSCVLPQAPIEPEIPNIPNTVHQIWKDNNLDTYPVRASHQAWKNAVEPLNYTVRLWTDADVDNLIETEYPWLQTTYNNYPHDIQRADIARLVVIHARGGIYADLDVHPRAVGEELPCLQRRYSHGGLFAPTAGGGVSNHFFLAAGGSPFLAWTLREAKNRGGRARWIWPPYLRVFWSTGPLMITAVFEEFIWTFDGWDHGLGVLEDGYFRKFVYHGAGRAWHGLDGIILNYVADRVRLNGVFAMLLLVVSLSIAAHALRRRLRVSCY